MVVNDMVNTYKNNISILEHMYACLVVFCKCLVKTNSNIHNILYTKHLNTYYIIYARMGYLINHVILLPCSSNLKNVFRCLECLLLSNHLNTTKHKPVLSSHPYMKTTQHLLCLVPGGVDLCR